MSEGSGDESPSLSIGRKKGDISPSPSFGEGRAGNLSPAPRRTSGGGDASPFLNGGKRANTARFPKYGWKVKINHKFPEKRDQYLKPRLSQMVSLLPLGIRYVFHWIYRFFVKKLPVIDQFRPTICEQIYGVPCGGMGSGTIGRGFAGEFCRWSISPGMYERTNVPADQFILTVHSDNGVCIFQSVLGGKGEPVPGAPSSWKWQVDPEDTLYCGLFPRSWTVYSIPQIGLRVICRQISPFLPGDYESSCLPASVFVFTVENNSDSKLQVSITFTFKNGTGGKWDQQGGFSTQPFQTDDNCGVTINGKYRGLPLSYSIGTAKHDSNVHSWCSQFDPKGTGSEVWDTLKNTGVLDCAEAGSDPTEPGEEVAVAVSNRTTVERKETSSLQFALAWDNPKLKFRDGTVTHTRRYARQFGTHGDAGEKLISHSLAHWQSWEESIEAWQQPILDDAQLPDWFKSAIFNELYFLTDGGCIWVEVMENEKMEPKDPRVVYGRFGYLEAHEYRMYNTYDVHFYASWALMDLFPGLEFSMQMDFVDCVDREDLEPWKELTSGKLFPRKARNFLPHDLGDPEEEPWVKINGYNIHCVNNWRDLNLKMVIQTWRDVKLLPNNESEMLLSRGLPVCRILMEAAQDWDEDNDGMIENSGTADTTYDNWVMKGPSAYVGNLYLAALNSMAEMEAAAGNSSREQAWKDKFEKAQKVYLSKLWEGSFFYFDTTERGKNVIMADQLPGHWFSKMANSKTDIVDEERVRKTLETVFENNVLKFREGNLGAVNGMFTNGQIDKISVQSEEMWTGIVYGLASLMIAEGLIDQGFKTAEGVYRTVYEGIGLGYATPEALYEYQNYRAVGYMRPLSIWSMLMAWRMHEEKKK